jgi:hypothetical protein
VIEAPSQIPGLNGAAPEDEGTGGVNGSQPINWFQQW